MSTILPDPDRWYIPPPVEAAAVRRGPGDGDLARIEALDADRMHDSLVFLAGYAPGVLDVILTATEPCLDDERPRGARRVGAVLHRMRRRRGHLHQPWQ